MEKNLPKVYASPITRRIDNNKDIFYSSSKDIRASSREDVDAKINAIFASKSHVYKSNVMITTTDTEFVTTIVGKTRVDLLTLTGEKIPINSIINIEKI